MTYFPTRPTVPTQPVQGKLFDSPQNKEKENSKNKTGKNNTGKNQESTRTNIRIVPDLQHLPNYDSKLHEDDDQNPFIKKVLNHVWLNGELEKLANTPLVIPSELLQKDVERPDPNEEETNPEKYFRTKIYHNMMDEVVEEYETWMQSGKEFDYKTYIDKRIIELAEGASPKIRQDITAIAKVVKMRFEIKFITNIDPQSV